MRKRVRLKKNILLKSISYLMMLCMIIGSIYIPVFAEEEIDSNSHVLKSGGSLPDDLEMEDQSEEQSENSEDNIETEGTQGGKELETGDDTGEKESNLDGENDEEEPGGDEAISEQEPEEELENNDEGELSGNDIKAKESAPKRESDEEPESVEVFNVVVPSAYLLALNPYSLPIKIGEDEITTEQVISGNYGIVNKSSTDQIVKVLLTVDDMNDGELIFVDSAEEARNAEEGVYAVYLAAVPANEEEILIDGKPVVGSITGEDLRNVEMTGAQEQAVTLHAGENEIAFRLSGAVYNIEEISSDDLEKESELEQEMEMVFSELAPNGTGVTAYTFWGVMNPNASWEKLSGGIKLSVVYTYQAADGSEEIVEGTGAMISMD